MSRDRCFCCRQGAFSASTLFLVLQLAGCASSGAVATSERSVDPPPPPLLEQRYDAARDSSTLRLVPAASPAQSPGPQLFVGATVPGKALSPPQQVLIGFRVADGRWPAERCQELTLIADGQLAGRMPLSRDAQLGDGQLTEYLSAVFPFVSIRLLAAASQPRALLCQTELSLTPEERAGLRQLVGRFLGASAK